MKNQLPLTKNDKQIKTLSKAFVLGCYQNKIYSKMDKYFTQKSCSCLLINLRLLFFNLKMLFKFSLPYRSKYSDNLCHILLSPGGGIGDHIYFLKYCACLKKQFQDTIKIDVFLRKNDKYLKDPLYKYADNIDSIFENKCPKHDVVIYLTRFPEIKFIDIRRLKQLCNHSLIEYLSCVSQFNLENNDFYRSDCLGRYYSQIHKRTRENQADIEDLLKMSSMTNFSLRINDEITDKALSKFGLSRDTYVILQTGPGRHFREIRGDTRQWPVEYYQKTISLLREKHPQIKFVQCGETYHKHINNVDIDLIGKTSLEEAFALIKYAKLLISAEGGYPIIRHFISRKISCVLFGPTNKDFFGFSENLNISSGECVGCEWLNKIWYKKCLLSKDKPLCMERLRPERLITYIEQERLL